jgi:2'-5' RNA ligase
LFFALRPGRALRRKIAGLQRRLRLSGRAVAEVNLHVTLAFLGEVPAGRVAELLEIGHLLRAPACTLVLDQLGCFERARVAWLGTGQPLQALQEFQASLAERLREAGFRSEARRWQPHLTLYRNLRTPLCKMPVEPVIWQLDSWCLMRSTLHTSGPVYGVVQRWATAETA